MTRRDQHDDADDANARRIAALVDDVRAARAAGKDVDDQTVLAAYPELMPQLAAALAKLRRIEAARVAATEPVADEVDAAAATSDFTFETAIPNVPQDEPRPRITIQAPGYSILREVNRGGQAVVYLAMQLSTGRKVALKVMRDGPLADERSLARFKREVSVLAALNHPNIVTIFDTGQTLDGSWYMAMDYIGGRSLDEYIKERQEKHEQDPSRLLRSFLKICAAVSAAHLRGVVHRDLKPSNIRIDDRGEPHILDFGLARTALDQIAHNGHAPISITGEFLGSLPWSSPEQAEGDPDKIDIRTDVYSLGVILYQMITGGRFPYDVVGNIRDVLNNILTAEPTPPSKITTASKDDRAVSPRLPFVNEAIEKIVLKALAKKREKRYQSAGEMGREIHKYLAGQETEASSVGKTLRPSPLKGGPWAIVTLAILICAVGAGVGHFAFRGAGAHQSSAGDAKPLSVVVGIGPAQARHVDSVTIVEPPKNDGWIDLFNGKNLDNWTIAGQTKWSVEDGVIVARWQPDGSRPADQLRYAGRQFANFRLRVVVSVERGAGGIIFRARPLPDWKTNYEARISVVGHGKAAPGSLNSDRQSLFVAQENPGVAFNQWVTYEIIAQGSKLTTIVNGQTAAEVTDPYDRNQKGEIGLRLSPGGPIVIRFKSVQIRELSNDAVATAAKEAPRVKASVPLLSMETRNASTTAPAPHATPPATAVPAGPPADAVAFNVHHFKLVGEKVGWEESATRCKEMGGHLARVGDQRVREFLQKLKGDSTIAWIGGHADAPGKWTWTDGTPIPLEQISLDKDHPEYRWLFLNSGGKLSIRPQDGHIEGAAYPDVAAFICEWDR